LALPTTAANSASNVAGGQMTISGRSLAGFIAKRASRRNSAAPARRKPFIFQLPATSGRGGMVVASGQFSVVSYQLTDIGCRAPTSVN
jgi:hypothetical protein